MLVKRPDIHFLKCKLPQVHLHMCSYKASYAGNVGNVYVSDCCLLLLHELVMTATMLYCINAKHLRYDCWSAHR